MKTSYLKALSRFLYRCADSTFPRWIMYACLCTWLATFSLMVRLPPAEIIDARLLNAPVQTDNIQKPAFTVEYQGVKNKVTPFAEYELYGLVVSHNDPEVWYRFDITHDDKSLNTRDVCVIWGKIAKQGSYQHVRFANSDTTCEYLLSGKTKYFSEDELSNNHLITADDDIRERIHTLRVGDQIHIKGYLANYSDERWKGFTRQSSGSRNDRGDGACEIIFVKELQILDSYNWFWYMLHTLSLWGFFGMVIFRIFLFLRYT